MKIKATIDNQTIELDVEESELIKAGYVKKRKARTCQCGFDYYDRHTTHNVATCTYKLERWLKDIQDSILDGGKYTQKYRNYIMNKEGVTFGPEFDLLIGVECLERAMDKLLKVKQIEEGFATSERINNYVPEVTHSCSEEL